MFPSTCRTPLFAPVPYSQVDWPWRTHRRTGYPAAIARSETGTACMLRAEYQACSTSPQDLPSCASRSFPASSSMLLAYMESRHLQRPIDPLVLHQSRRFARTGRAAPDDPTDPNLRCSSLAKRHSGPGDHSDVVHDMPVSEQPQELRL